MAPFLVASVSKDRRDQRLVPGAAIGAQPKFSHVIPRMVEDIFACFRSAQVTTDTATIFVGVVVLRSKRIQFHDAIRWRVKRDVADGIAGDISPSLTVNDTGSFAG